MSAAIKAVLFDLDGTLVDTAPDLAYSLNQTRLQQNLPELPIEEIRPHVSHGAQAMIRAGFGIGREDDKFDELREFLLDIYQNNLCRHSRTFEGMDHVLEQLEARRIQWGIVTNKPAYLTDPLTVLLGFDKRCACIISGDTLPRNKPDPTPLLHGCKLAGVSPGETIYVGDAIRDIEAGRRAGARTLAARYGYLAEDDRPEQWQADGIIDSPGEILDWLD